jgi:cell division protein FtsQ
LANVRAGTHLFNANLDRAVAGVQQHPWVARATARRRFPGSVEIHVQEHIPTLLLALDELWLVDTEANVFKRANTDLMDFPVLSGISPQVIEEHPRVARAIIDDALALHQAVNADAHLSIDDLSEIHFEERTGFSLVLRSGTRVTIGFADPAKALDRLDHMRDRGLNLETPQHIDLDAGAVAIATPLP